MYQKDAVSQKVYDDATAKKMETDASVLGAQAKLDQANLNLSYTEIKAPFDGRIGLATHSVGNLVGPDSGMLADIARLDPVRVQYNLSEVELLDFLRNKDVDARGFLIIKLFFQDGKQYDQPGEITFWNNQVNPSTGTLLMQATFPNPKSILIPGLYVKVKIETKEVNKAVMIPRNAVIEDQTGKYVLIVNKSDIVERRQIVPAADQNQQDMDIGLKSGVQPGEMVIVDGIQKVRPGMKVKAEVMAAANPLDANGSSASAGNSTVPAVSPALLTKSSNNAPPKLELPKTEPKTEHKSTRR